jgi:inhibitor of cysteine peptidase
VLRIGEEDDGRRIAVSVGDEIEVRLSENATTGYRWAAEPSHAGLEVREGPADYGGATGSGGAAVFRVRVRSPGEVTLAFKHWRAFEGDASVTRRFCVTLDARA